MGVIDKTTYAVTCECGATETQRILDKGSMWSGSHWGSAVAFEQFKTRWSAGGGPKEPTLQEAICKACGKVAVVSVS